MASVQPGTRPGPQPVRGASMDKLVEILVGSYPKRVVLDDGSAVNFRPLRKSDEAALGEFFRSLPLKDRACLKDDVADPQVIARWIHHLDFDNVLPLVATDDGRIVGDVTLHFDPVGWTMHRGEIRLTTDTGFRTRGLGKKLTQEIIDIATRLGLEQLSIELSPKVPEAFQLCQKLGFAQAALLKGFIIDLDGNEGDLVLMVKNLET